ncbi:MAG: hypothetical protein Q7V05_09760 [Methanoregula sp.]|nr:hypothetical protein [Methanoregula sp.]
MYDFIKNLINPKKTAPVVIAFSSIPAWVAGREKNARKALEEAAKAPMQNIRNSAAQLQHIVNSISGSEHDPAIHPKLKAVAKNSLPLYVKAMNAALAKPLSDDIEVFYTDAVECLKSSLNGNRGQGRYLQAVFPEEMKGVKLSIDAMGKEMNILTAALATYQKQKAAIDAVATLHQSIQDMQEDLQRTVEKEHRTLARISEITSRIGAIEREETELASDADGNRAVNECKSALAEKEKKRNEVTRNYAARSMTASHVFKKAEKIAAKQHQTGDISSLKHAIEILSDHDLPDPLSMSTALAAACPVVQRMIAAGEIPLKNREEREVFSNTDAFCTTMSELCTELAACDEACTNAETTLLTHPRVVRGNSLMREKTQLNSMLNKEQQLYHELAQWTAKTNEKIPAVTEELRKKIEGIIGGSVQLQADMNAPV